MQLNWQSSATSKPSDIFLSKICVDLVAIFVLHLVNFTVLHYTGERANSLSRLLSSITWHFLLLVSSLLTPLLTYTSIHLFHFPNDLLLKNGQDIVVLSNLFKHHPAVELVAHLLEIISKEERLQIYIFFDQLCFEFFLIVPIS